MANLPQPPQLASSKDASEVTPEILLRVKSVFPFDLFPSEVIVTTNSVAIIDNFFWGTSETKTILIQDIFNVDLIKTPFFCNVQITNRQAMLPVIEIKYLRKKDGDKLKDTIQGLLLMKAENVDIDKYSAAQINPQIRNLGSLTTT